MNAPLADVSSGIFDVLGLPLELRQSIYRLHLSNEGEVDYLGAEDNTEEITHDKPAIKPLLGANVLRVCKQIYDEAILSAYDNRKWAMGYAPITPDRLTVNCAQRLARILPATAEKIQRLSLNIEITLETPYKLVRSTAMGDPAKLKSLRTLELFLVLGDIGVRATRWVYQRDSTWRNAPFLVGLICEILAQVPSHIGVVWLVAIVLLIHENPQHATIALLNFPSTSIPKNSIKMLVPCVIPFWLIALYVLLASAAFSDQNGLLCARQRPAQLHIHGNRNYQQQMSLQPAIESASSRLLLRAAFTSPSFKHSDTRTLAQASTHTNSTQLAYGSDGLWAGDSRPFRSQGESLNDGLIPRIENMKY
ncbi:hypothetical protein KCU91_g6335, partial [Aureobasidium melanogenum]